MPNRIDRADLERELVTLAASLSNRAAVLRAVPNTINSSPDMQPYREGKAEAYVDAAAWVTEVKNRLCQ